MIPNIYISKEIIHTIRLLEQIGNNYEWSGELWGHVNDTSVFIETLSLNKQVVTRVNVNGSIESARRSAFRHETIFYHQQKGTLTGRSLVGWIHSHVFASAFLSGTDTKQILQYQTEIPLVTSIVVSRSISDSVLIQHGPDGLHMGIWLDGRLTNVKYIKFKVDQSHVIFDPDWFEDTISASVFREVWVDYQMLVTRVI